MFDQRTNQQNNFKILLYCLSKDYIQELLVDFVCLPCFEFNYAAFTQWRREPVNFRTNCLQKFYALFYL